MTVMHVEMADSEMFCGLTIPPAGASVSYTHAIVPPRPDCVLASRWHPEPEAIQQATCERCLLRLFMIGDSASIALKRMGMKVEVHDAPAETELS